MNSLYTIKHTWDNDWNHPAATGVIEKPSDVQSITSLSFACNHSFTHLKCQFLRKSQCTERGDGCADLAMSLINLSQKKVENILQHKVFLLITQADTNCHQESPHFPDECTKKGIPRRFGRWDDTWLILSKDVLRIFATAHTSFAPEAPRRKRPPQSGIIGTVSSWGRRLWRILVTFCVRVGNVGANSEAGIEAEDTGFGEGREVSGWVPWLARSEKGRSQGVSNARKEGRGEGEETRQLTIFPANCL